jgi:hypothetical protein
MTTDKPACPYCLDDRYVCGPYTDARDGKPFWQCAVHATILREPKPKEPSDAEQDPA